MCCSSREAIVTSCVLAFISVIGCVLFDAPRDAGAWFTVFFLACLFSLPFISIACVVEENEAHWQAFYARVGGGTRIRQPYRVQRMYQQLTPAGADAIKTYEQFVEDERLLFPSSSLS